MAQRKRAAGEGSPTSKPLAFGGMGGRGQPRHANEQVFNSFLQHQNGGTGRGMMEGRGKFRLPFIATQIATQLFGIGWQQAASSGTAGRKTQINPALWSPPVNRVRDPCNAFLNRRSVVHFFSGPPPFHFIFIFQWGCQFGAAGLPLVCSRLVSQSRSRSGFPAMRPACNAQPD